jgi:hypothetical protein
MIKNINIVSYDYIDPFKGGHREYDVVAQDVHDIIPSIVTKITDIIPNIMNRALFVLCNDYVCLTVQMNEIQDITIGKIIVLYISNKDMKEERELKTKIKYVNDKEGIIHVEKWDMYDETDHVFIYGTEVDDFLSVDKVALGIVALQGVKEVTTIIEHQKFELEHQKSELNKLQVTFEERIAQLEKIIHQQNERISILEKYGK